MPFISLNWLNLQYYDGYKFQAGILLFLILKEKLWSFHWVWWLPLTFHTYIVTDKFVYILYILNLLRVSWKSIDFLSAVYFVTFSMVIYLFCYVMCDTWLLDIINKCCIIGVNQNHSAWSLYIGALNGMIKFICQKIDMDWKMTY